NGDRPVQEPKDSEGTGTAGFDGCDDAGDRDAFATGIRLSTDRGTTWDTAFFPGQNARCVGEAETDGTFRRATLRIATVRPARVVGRVAGLRGRHGPARRRPAARGAGFHVPRWR